VPLGKDHDSGLWEFAYLPSGELPAFKDGHVVPSPEMAAVLVLVPACQFWMGAQNQDPLARNYVADANELEGPVREVSFGGPFFLAKYELTQGQWQRLIGTSPSWYRLGGSGTSAGTAKPERDDPLRPVENVSWFDCQELGQAGGLRLPSEAEWELAARAGTDTAYGFGDDAALLGDHGWYLDNSKEVIHPVGEKKPNRFGLHDVHGNVWEWCQDAWAGDRSTAPTDGSATVLPEGAWHVFRGGGMRDLSRHCHSSIRSGGTPAVRSETIGVRPARSVQ